MVAIVYIQVYMYSLLMYKYGVISKAVDNVART